MGGPPPLSESLRTAIEPPTVGVITDHGYDERPGPWKPPRDIDADMAADAARQLAWLDDVGMRPAGAATMRGWLVALGNACANSSAASSADVTAKIGVLLTLLDGFSTACFTKASLKRAAEQFKFFPAAAELTKFLSSEESALRLRRDRMRILATPARNCQVEASTAAFIHADDGAKARVRELLAKAGIGLRVKP